MSISHGSPEKLSELSSKQNPRYEVKTLDTSEAITTVFIS